MQTVVIFTGIFKEAIHGVQNLVRKQEEPLPRREHTTKCVEQWHTVMKHVIIDMTNHRERRIESIQKENNTEKRHQSAPKLSCLYKFILREKSPNSTRIKS